MKAKLLLVSALALAIAAPACSTSWITTAEQYVQVLTPAIEDIVGILTLAGVKGASTTQENVVAEYAQQATTDLNTVNTLLTQYNSANATTTLQQINAAAQDAANNLNEILPALHISDPTTVSKADAAVTLAVNTLAELEALLPASTSTTPTLASALLAERHKAAAKPPKPSVLQNEFNQIFAK
jgi:hypothetical protein